MGKLVHHYGFLLFNRKPGCNIKYFLLLIVKPPHLFGQQFEDIFPVIHRRGNKSQLGKQSPLFLQFRPAVFLLNLLIQIGRNFLSGFNAFPHRGYKFETSQLFYSLDNLIEGLLQLIGLNRFLGQSRGNAAQTHCEEKQQKPSLQLHDYLLGFSG